MLGVEMASTGEVGCFGDDLHEALLHALIATGFRFPKKGVLLSLGPDPGQVRLRRRGAGNHWQLGSPNFRDPGTAEALRSVGIDCVSLSKGPRTCRCDPGHRRGTVDLVINIPREYDEQGRPDGYWIPSPGRGLGIPLFTDLKLARAVVEAMRHKNLATLNSSRTGSTSPVARWKCVDPRVALSFYAQTPLLETAADEPQGARIAVHRTPRAA